MLDYLLGIATALYSVLIILLFFSPESASGIFLGEFLTTNIFIQIVALIISLILSVLLFISGNKLKQKKYWAKIATIIFALISVIGTNWYGISQGGFGNINIISIAYIWVIWYLIFSQSSKDFFDN